MKSITKKIKIAKRYIDSFYNQRTHEVLREELIKDVKASVYLSLSEAIIQKYLELQNHQNKIMPPIETQFLTRSEFTEFVGFICMKLNAEVDALQINTRVRMGSKTKNYKNHMLNTDK